jgi:hypothetical protein
VQDQQNALLVLDTPDILPQSNAELVVDLLEGSQIDLLREIGQVDLLRRTNQQILLIFAANLSHKVGQPVLMVNQLCDLLELKGSQDHGLVELPLARKVIAVGPLLTIAGLQHANDLLEVHKLNDLLLESHYHSALPLLLPYLQILLKG